MGNGEPRGTVFDIQRYAIHDGPGIRTTVYFKGCPLICPWCHNPESQSPEPELYVDGERCIACGACVEACPQAEPDAAATGGRSLPDQAKCLRCGHCAEACVTGARRMVGWSVSAGQLLEEILRDRPFYETSGGGVTFSGGEPLMQAEFLAAALAACRRQGLHTAVDTCGYAARGTIEAVSALTDLWLYDLKTLDPEQHARATGVALAPILENLRRLDHAGARVWIRIPLIPGFNDSDQDLDAMGSFVASLVHTRRVHLLPFHRGAEEKHRRLARGAGYARFAPPSGAWVDEAQRRLGGYGLEVVAGG